MSTEKVRELNDALRKSFSGGKVVVTASVNALPDMVRANALLEGSPFDRFTEDKDPHGEHDFGSFEMVGRAFFWKLDYYDATMEFGSEDPSDPAKTTRVLTLMLAEDYCPRTRGSFSISTDALPAPADVSYLFDDANANCTQTPFRPCLW
jgi:hypothetical protein